MDAWSSDPIPPERIAAGYAAGAPGRDRFSGQAVPQLPLGWRHRAASAVRLWTTLATRLTLDQLRFKVVTGGGNMPAYGKNLSPPEIEALVAFSIRCIQGEHPAVDPSTLGLQTTHAGTGENVPAAKNSGP